MKREDLINMEWIVLKEDKGLYTLVSKSKIKKEKFGSNFLVFASLI